MQQAIRRILYRSELGQKIYSHLRNQKVAFKPASGPCFQFLNQNAIGEEYERAFERIFLLLNAFCTKGDIYEFGTYRGFTARLFAKYMLRCKMHDSHLHLFDSFEGFPEEEGFDQSSYESKNGAWKPKGMNVPLNMDLYIEKKLSKLLKDRLHVCKGFFSDTLPDYKFKNKARLVHMDCDLYSSSQYVLNHLFSNDIVQDGTIFIFDDWMTSRGNPNLGQKKATAEILEAYPHFTLEPYFNYGIGASVFVLHDLRVEASAC
ncbi:MAG: hypothetical protein S4CHLAM81_08660 [Chlamydiales bacterium]|nr:hypothetical protein [Chlamydiales bacterium]MCH9635646.1 hypothetical protein [Chlamydiales bacterium]